MLDCGVVYKWIENPYGTVSQTHSCHSSAIILQYKTYTIKSGQSILPFVFNDIMGLESEESHGAQPEDIVKALQGFLKEGHKVSVLKQYYIENKMNTFILRKQKE